MKRVLISVLITFFAVFFSIFSGNFIEKKILTLEEGLYSCNISIRENDFISAEEKLNELSLYWDKNKTSVGLFISGEDCKNFEQEMNRLRLFMSNKSTDFALEGVGKCLNILRSIKEDEKPSLDSIL